MGAQVTTSTTLLEALRDGRGDAWRDFSDRYGGLIRGVARRYLLQPADADDVLQEVLIGLTRALPQFAYDPARARFRTFLRTIVQRAIFRKLRQNHGAARNGHLEETAADSAGDAIWEAEWRQHHLRQAMATIEAEFGPADRRAFALYVGGGQSAAETASELGLSVDSVYQAKSRILRRLREVIARQVADEG